MQNPSTNQATPSRITYVQKLYPKDSQQTQALLRDLNALHQTEVSSGVQTPLGRLQLHQEKEKKAPFLTLNIGSSNHLFSFEEAFSNLNATSLRGIRFCISPNKPGSLLAAAKLQLTSSYSLIALDLLADEWHPLVDEELIDFDFLNCETLAILSQKEGKLTTTLYDLSGKLLRTFTLPNECIYGSVENLNQKGVKVTCTTGKNPRFLFVDAKDREMSRIARDQLIDIALFANAVFGLTKEGEVLLLDRRSSTQITLPNSLIPEKLTALPTGLLVQARNGAEKEFLFYKATKDFHFLPPLRIAVPGCSLSLVPFVGETNSISFTCEDRLGFGEDAEVFVKLDPPSRTTTDVQRPFFRKLLFATSKDGEAIPFHLYLKHQGDRPSKILLTSYGAYGSAPETHSSLFLRALFDAGFGIAVAYPRGSGFYGERWHEQGRGRNKANVIFDLLAVSNKIRETLQPKVLIGHGKSAGAWPYVASLTLKPDTFDALILEMPVLSPVKQITPADQYYQQELHEWGEFSEGTTKAFYDSLDLANADQTDSLPAIYIRIAEQDALLAPEGIEQWIAEVAARQTNIRITIERNRNTTHTGSLNTYDELLSISRRVLFANSIQ